MLHSLFASKRLPIGPFIVWVVTTEFELLADIRLVAADASIWLKNCRPKDLPLNDGNEDECLLDPTRKIDR
jgi:hypothetical protein